MKTGIHPTYHTEVKVSCACGNTFVTGSTAESIQVEICANCHPFYTGKSKLIDTAGRVDKFKARLERAAQAKAGQKTKQALKSAEKPSGELISTPAETESQPDEK